MTQNLREKILKFMDHHEEIIQDYPEQMSGYWEDFITDEITSLLSKLEAEARKKQTNRKNYDGNNLESASDYYEIGAKTWDEVIRYENGYNQALSDILSLLQSYKSKLTDK